MKIRAIEADNFRTLEDFKLSFSPHYCALSGRNNAGKSAVVSIIQFFLEEPTEYRFLREEEVTYAEDSTQWSEASEMSIGIELRLKRNEDSELFFVVQKLSGLTIEGDEAIIALRQKFPKDGASQLHCALNGNPLDNQASSEVLKKLKSSFNLIVHNSTQARRNFFVFSSSFAEILETNFSAEDRKRISQAQKRLQSSVKKAAKQHKEELDKLLGRLSDKYHVELTAVEGGPSSKFPLQVKLTDSRVGVSLEAWGAGTQNRTRILISILEVIRMRSSSSTENRTTPVFIVEEPESFLHPSAQAEFGNILNDLANELNIQIIATTHSPYMLNQDDPKANYLLERRAFRGIPRETTVKDTSGEDWMLPFADNLGIMPREFHGWKSLFGANATRVVLVEGEIDKEYFTHIKEKYPEVYSIPDDVEILPYGGKDALKNTALLKFMINRFGKIYVTYDLDADEEACRALERIGLQKDVDFCAVGVNRPGSDCVEGLLPTSIKKKVFSDHFELVTELSSQQSNVRRNAKDKLKKEFLQAVKGSDLSVKDLSEFRSLFSKIAKQFK
jgi:putative ATP-dependent endonuclease of the OLD family